VLIDDFDREPYLVVKGCLGETIDVRSSSTGAVCRLTRFVQFKKVDDLVSKSNLTSGDVKGAIAGIDFIIKSGCKYNVDEETLAMELQQLGLPTGTTGVCVGCET
jgi:hypothetical protein